MHPEGLLALAQHAADLGDGAGGAFAVGAGGDAADVRQLGQGGESAADQVEAVDGDVAGGVGECQGQREGAQQGGLAGLRAADERGVAAGDGQVQDPLALPLLLRVVEQAERDAHRAVRLSGQGQSVSGGDEGAGGLVEGERVRERRQPDPADRLCGGAQLVDHHRHGGGAGFPYGHVRLGLARLARGVAAGVVGAVWMHLRSVALGGIT